MKRLEISLSTNSTETLLEEYYKYKNELESIYNFIAEGIILRSKASWYKHGEKSSKYFLNLEKRNKAKSHLRKIINSDGHEVCDETEIRQKLKQFYSSLYKRRSNKTVDERMSYLANISLPKLTDEENLSCKGKKNQAKQRKTKQSKERKESNGRKSNETNNKTKTETKTKQNKTKQSKIE